MDMFDVDGRPLVIHQPSHTGYKITFDFVSRDDQLAMANRVCKQSLGISLSQFATLKAMGALAFDGPCHSKLVTVESLIPADWLQRVSGQPDDSQVESPASTQTTGEG